MTKPKWPELPWDIVVDRVSPLVFRVYAGNSAGTAFVVSLASSREDPLHFAILATANHVLAKVAETGEKVTLVSSDRANVFDTENDEMRVQPLGPPIHDTMLVLLKSKRQIVKQSALLPMLPWDSMLARGAEVGWLGFPGLVEPELCFFNGHVSGHLGDPPTYFIDGVAINGVSGGPAFDNRAQIIGLVSAYIPNRVNDNTTLPGLMALVPINAIRMFMETNMDARVL